MNEVRSLVKGEGWAIFIVNSTIVFNEHNQIANIRGIYWCTGNYNVWRWRAYNRKITSSIVDNCGDVVRCNLILRIVILSMKSLSFAKWLQSSAFQCIRAYRNILLWNHLILVINIFNILGWISYSSCPWMKWAMFY